MLKDGNGKGDLGAPVNKQYYKKKAAEHFKLYEKAIERGDTKAANYHTQEYLTYKKASE